jgi:hypothetical protein
MTQRNPMNERNLNESRKGVSRKSAASAKPSKDAASTVNVEPVKKTPKEKKMEKRQKEAEARREQQKIAAKYSTPDTPEFYKWKRIWWIGLGAAILFVLSSWLLREVDPQWISLVVLGFAYAAIIFAFWVDAAKIKKITRKWQEEMVEKEKRENKGKSKKQIAEEERAAAEQRRKEDEERMSKSFLGRHRLARIKAAEAKQAAKEKEKEEKKKKEESSKDKKTTK